MSLAGLGLVAAYVMGGDFGCTSGGRSGPADIQKPQWDKRDIAARQTYPVGKLRARDPNIHSPIPRSWEVSTIRSKAVMLNPGAALPARSA